MEKSNKIIIGIIAVAIIGLGVMFYKDSSTPGQYDGLAQCLKDKGAVFYGAFWCPHCQATKKLFGKSAKLLPYVECSTADGRSQLPICKDNAVESYPTWLFPDGIKVTSIDSPIICDIQPGPADQNALCAERGSKIFKTFLFSDISVKSKTDPIHEGDIWKFDSNSQALGELSLQTISAESSCPLN